MSEISNIGRVSTNIVNNNTEQTDNKQIIDNKDINNVVSMINQEKKLSDDIKLQNGEMISPADYNAELDKLTNEEVETKKFLLNTDLFKSVFIGNKKSAFSSRSIADRAPHILTHQKNALNVDANFIKKVGYKMMEVNFGVGPYAFLELYNLATTQSQLSFVDMLFAKKTGDFIGKATGNKEFGEATQIAIAELLASGNKDSIKNALEEIKLLNDSLRKDVTDKKVLDLLDQTETHLKSIADQKLQFISEIEAHHKEIKLDKNGKSIVKDVDPSNWTQTHYSINDTKSTNIRIPTYCGICSVMTDPDNLKKFNEVHQFSTDCYRLNHLYNEFTVAFRGTSLSTTSYAFLEQKLKQNDLQCDFLYKMLEDHSGEVKESLLKKIDEKINSNITGPELGPMLAEITRSIKHDLSEADQQAVNMRLAEAISELKETDNLKGKDFENLKLIATAIVNDPSLQPTLPVIISAFEKTDFETSAFNKFATQLADPKLTDFKDKVSDFLNQMNEALSDKTKTVDFMNKLISLSEDMHDTIDLSLSVLEQFHYRDPALCSHLHEAYFAKNIITNYINNLPEENKRNLLSSITEKDADPAEQALNNILTKPFSEITAADYKAVLTGFDSIPKFKDLEPMWQAFLNAGWQHTVLESDEQDKSMMPVNASNLSVHENANGEYLYGNPAIRDMYLMEIVAGNAQNAIRLKNTHLGLTHTQAAGSEIKGLHNTLNTKFKHGESFYAVMNSTDYGKSLVALDQMREEAVHLQGKYWYDVNHADKNEDQLLSLRIPKPNNLIYNYTQLYGGLKEKIDAQKDEINNPSVMNVIDANKAELKESGKTIPDDKTIIKNCTKVASTVKLLGENLVDDLYTYNNANLEKFGLTDVENLRVPKESEDKMKQYNVLLLNKNAGLMTEEQFQNEIKALNMDDVNKQFDAAMESLRKNIKNVGITDPLSKIGELLVKKYGQLYSLKFGAELAMAQVSSKMTDRLLADERYNDELTYLKNPQKDANGKEMNYIEYVSYREQELQLESKSLYLTTYAANSEMYAGDFSNMLAGDMLFGNAVVSEIMLQCDLSSSMEKAIYDALSRPVLSNEDKRMLIHTMNQNHKNVNLDTLTDGGKPNMDFTDSIVSVISSNGDEFNSKLNDFINTQLNAERQLNSYGVLLSHSHEVKNKSEVDELLSQERMIGSHPSDALKTIFEMERNVLLNQVEHSQQTQKEIRKIAACVGPTIDGIYKNSAIHTYLRFAACYAATKMNYSGSQDLFNSYHKMSTADQKKAMDLMIHALQMQNFDVGMARLLIEKRLADPNSNSLINNVIRSIRSAFYSFRLMSKAKKTKAADVKLASTIPAVKEFISSINKSNILALSRNFNFVIDAMNPVNKFAIPAGALPVKFAATLNFLGTSGLTFSRDNSGRFHIHADLSKFGLKVGVGVNSAQVGAQASGEMHIGGETLRVTDLAFEDDEGAVLFISKMLCGVLTSEDVNTARNVAVGSKSKFNTGLSFALGAAPFQGLMNAPQSGADDGLFDKCLNAAGGFGVDMIDNLNFGRIGASLEYNYSTSTVEGISGTTVTSTHEFTVTGEFNIAHGGAYDGMIHTTAGVLAPEITKITNNLSGGDLKSEEKYLANVDNAGKTIDNLLNHKKVKEIVNKKSIVHYPLSAGDPKIPDGASNTFTSSKLTKAHIDMMRKSGLVSEDTIKGFEKVLAGQSKMNVGPVHTVFKLKQSAIDEMKAHPEKVNSILSADDSYEFDRIDLELPKKSHTEDNGLALLVSTIGAVIGISYTNQTTAQGTQILSYKAGVLQ